MYLNDMELRGIERVTDIHHTTVMARVKGAGLNLPSVSETDEEPEITDLTNYRHLRAISGTKFRYGR
jgi:hypothetical protein